MHWCCNCAVNYLVIIAAIKIYNYNCNHLHICNNYSCGKYVLDTFLLFFVNNNWIVDKNRLLLIPLKKKKIILKKFATLEITCNSHSKDSNIFYNFFLLLQLQLK